MVLFTRTRAHIHTCKRPRNRPLDTSHSYYVYASFRWDTARERERGSYKRIHAHARTAQWIRMLVCMYVCWSESCWCVCERERQRAMDINKLLAASKLKIIQKVEVKNVQCFCDNNLYVIISFAKSSLSFLLLFVWIWCFGWCTHGTYLSHRRVHEPFSLFYQSPPHIHAHAPLTTRQLHAYGKWMMKLKRSNFKPRE